MTKLMHDKSSGAARRPVKKTAGRKVTSDANRSHRQEAELRRANRALRTISSCNQALIHATDEIAMMEDICRAIVEEGGYRLAWVGYAENDARKTVRPVACAGYEAGYLKQVKITWADEPRGRGPTGTAIRTRQPAVCRDTHTDPDFAPWRADAVKRGYGASIVLPMLDQGGVLGAISIYAEEPGAFDPAEVRLLQELADDLVFGLHTLRDRLAHQAANEALRRAGVYNRNLIEASLDPLVTIGPDGRITDVNSATEKVTGRSRTELIGTDFSEYFTEPARARAGYEQVFRDGLVRDYPLELRHRDGRLTSVLYNASVYRDERGKVIGVFAAARDVTERERASEALRRSEEELKIAQRIAHVGSWWMDNTTNEVVWTEELYRMLGLDPALPPPPYPEHHRLFTPESWQRLSTALPRTQETGVPYELELELVRPDGSRGWMLARGEPLRNAAGAISGLRGSAQDITERKRAEAALKESEESFRTLAEAMPQIVWATRVDGWNTYFNQRWVDYTGMTLEESHGHGWNKPFHPEDQQRAWEAWQAATQHGATYSLEVRLRRKDGAYRWWLVRGAPLLDATGKTLKWFGTCTDIHDLKMAEEKIRQLNVGLEQRVRERTQALAESEARLQSVLQATSTGTFEIDLPTGEGRWNDVEFALLGLKRGDVPPGPESFFRYVHPDDVGPLTERWERAKHSGELDAEFRVVRADGQERWLAGKGHFTYDHPAGGSGDGPLGQPRRFLGINFDITERKRGEQALQQYRQDLDRAQQVGQIGSWRLDVRCNRLTWSEENHRIFGVPTGTPLTYETFLGIIHPDDRAYVDSQWQAGLGGAPYDIEHRLVVDGRVKWVREKAYLEFDEAGRLLGGFGITQDITERKHAERALKESEQRLALAVDAAQEGVWDWDVATDRLDWSPHQFRMFGLDPGRTGASFEAWRNALHPADRAAAEARIQTALARHTRLESEYRVVLPSGEIRWISALGDATYDSAGQPLRMSGVCLDITARKRAELELQNMADRLQAANQELESFSYSVSHDLRAPLRSIDGFSRIVLEDCGDQLNESGRTSLQRVRAASQRMAELIDDLLRLSRTVRTEMHLQPLDLSALVHEAVANLLEAEPARHVDWVVAPGLEAVADRTLLRLVLENLLGNAWKFTSRRAGDARIEFGQRVGDGGRAFFVRDNGAGFDPAYADKLFVPFQRLHSREEFPGNGIGLATVQRIIHRHGGRVWAEGRTGEGATFFFTLPQPEPPT